MSESTKDNDWESLSPLEKDLGKGLLFINGTPPKQLPNLDIYSFIACTDGAFGYLKKLDFPIEKLDLVSGDFDSHSEFKKKDFNKNSVPFKIIFTPNQDKTDFEKALEILSNKDISKVDVFGGSGREMDHFLGNLTAAFHFKNKMDIRFFDDYSTYYFIPKNFNLKNVKGKTISLYPFPVAENITTKGLKWSLNHETLELTKRIGTRNLATEDNISITYEKGNLLIFVEEKYS